MDKVFRAAAMITVHFIYLSVLYCSSQPNHEFFCHALDSIGVIAFWILTIIGVFFFQLHQVYGRFLREWLTTLQFPQGKEVSGPGFGWTICCLGPGASRQLNQILLFSLPGGPKVIQICSHPRSHLEVGHHCLQSFKKSAIKTISHQFGYVIWRKMVWEGCCQYL